MSDLRAFAGFLAVSLVVHAGAFMAFDESGATSGEANEAEPIALSTASSDYVALAESWVSEPPAPDAPNLVVPQVPQASAAITNDSAITRPEAPSFLPAPASSGALPSQIPEPPPEVTNVATETTGLALPDISSAAAPGLATDQAPRRPQAPTPPSLAAPEVSTAPELDTTPYFDSASDLAALISPRPELRPRTIERPAVPAAPRPAPAEPATSRPETRAPPAPRAPASTGGASAPSRPAEPAPPPRQGLSEGQIRSLVGQWGGQIHARIARSRPASRGRGTTVVQITVATNGRLAGVSVARSSGDPSVDQAALEAVRRAGRLPRAPAGLPRPSYAFSISLTFQ